METTQPSTTTQSTQQQTQVGSQQKSDKSRLRRSLVSLLLIIPTGILIYLPTALLLILAFGFDYDPKSVFDYLMLVSIVGSAVTLSLLPSALSISKIYQNKKLFKIPLALFIIFLVIFAASIFGLRFKEEQKVSQDFEKAKSFFQVYEPKYLPDGVEIERSRGVGGQLVELKYSLGKGFFFIRQAPNPDDSYFFKYECAMGVINSVCEGLTYDKWTWVEIEIDGQSAYYFEQKFGGNSFKELILVKNSTYLLIDSGVSLLEKGEMLKIAESLEPID